MTAVHHIERMVEFHETDMAGIAHFSNYFRYMELGETHFLRAAGLMMHNPQTLGVGWPRVHAEADYMGPLFFEDRVGIETHLKAIKKRALEYVHIIRKLNQEGQPVVAVGQIVCACTTLDKQTRKLKAVAIPEEILAKLSEAPKEGYAPWLRSKGASTDL